MGCTIKPARTNMQKAVESVIKKTISYIVLILTRIYCYGLFPVSTTNKVAHQERDFRMAKNCFTY